MTVPATQPHLTDGPPRRRLSPWRCVAAAVGLLMLAGAAFFSAVAAIEGRAFERAMHEPVGSVEADLSRPGVSEATLREWYPAAHGVALRVRPEGGAMPAAFPALRGTIQIFDGRGEVVETAEVSGEPPDGPGPREGRIARYNPPRAGAYTVRLTVTHPEPALANVPHRVVAEYQICGCEALAGVFSGLLGAGLAFVGGLTTLVVFTTGGIRRGDPWPEGVSSSP